MHLQINQHANAGAAVTRPCFRSRLRASADPQDPHKASVHKSWQWLRRTAKPKTKRRKKNGEEQEPRVTQHLALARTEKLEKLET